MNTSGFQHNPSASSVDASAKSGPLQGIKVVDLSRVISGPLATMILADQGADVIKVEPREGDNLRYMGPQHNNVAACFFPATAINAPLHWT